ncbi:MAG: HPF/RaiA family ribosome-associated protein [Paludibacteraceae bacterium]|nr:HPF/RaiA family ribosome-associated protein [Paludibacteraceae bacterium]
MTINIKDIDFQLAQKLEEYTHKKAAKISKLLPSAETLNITYKLIKPETNMNKEAQLRLNTKDGELFASKVADTFEDALLQAIEALEHQIDKFKEKNK